MPANDVTFSFLTFLYLECVHRHDGDSIFARKSALKCALKINRSVKTRDMGLVWVVLAPGYGLAPATDTLCLFVFVLFLLLLLFFFFFLQKERTNLLD